MCGFAGFLYKQSLPENVNSILDEMGMSILSRGPDSSGVWSCNEDMIGLSHRRLAIVDLSPAGHQPMVSHSGRYVIAFNGEIYNHLDIRIEIEKEKPVQWFGHSDTETLLTGIELWGLETTLKKSIGMFAISLWDKHEKALYLARDRFGEKPLYYSTLDNMFIFGSELKSLRAHPDFKTEISRGALALLMRHNYIPAPYSIYEGVSKLMPGTFLKKIGHALEIKEYWNIRDSFVEEGNSFESNTVAIDSLETTLKLAISRQMMADVPLGAFLSGGIDSSLIVALMQSLSDRPVKTFSIGFTEEAFNEAEHAKRVAKHLGTEHTELYVSDQDALNVVKQLADIYDEPFSDSSQIPTFLVSKMARKHVTVSLSGDAGDELFCGYNRYLMTAKLWSKLSLIPLFMRNFLSKGLLLVTPDNWNKFNLLLPSGWRMANFGDKLHKAAGVITCSSVDELYKSLVSHWQNPEDMVLKSQEPLTAITDPARKPHLSNPISEMMALDTISYMTDDILVKVDRAAMANSLETRVPFLDHTVFEHAWKMPFETKLNNGVTKDCLRKILYKYVPKELIERPKVGFGVPLDSWLRGPLKDWADNLLDKDRLINEGFFDADLVVNKWDEHKSGKRNWQYLLWDVLMFQVWYEKHHK
ncbi:asparagine synthase (glutamine-hydrolyzing) [Shewanella sp. OMA3-2]|uniref:asparagine synthase (glutamine-hydrolyzing) n=1 Tax=Shewanella sp. OMA3-2 TaxID=2908650 RepID=UPI001F3C3AD4|nr:asparagine synthase (glutamine-hydrolyzing) [Shewanella sp. OMA3-2]UJF23145.1 asparagine synthase (glutamine-hydrolyzing) [Shewanella sp. OMA3-2]